jgi:hypothetical protein
MPALNNVPEEWVDLAAVVVVASVLVEAGLVAAVAAVTVLTPAERAALAGAAVADVAAQAVLVP